VERLGLCILAGLGLLLGRCLALGDGLAGGVWDDALSDLGDGLAGGRVGDGGKTAREDGRAQGWVQASAGLNGACSRRRGCAYLSAS
jgi:hypothetical protein